MEEAFFKPARRSIDGPGMDLEEIRKALPFLTADVQDEKREALKELTLLIHEVANAWYSYDKKYSLMYKVIKIGDLVDFVFSKYKEEANATALRECELRPAVANLSLVQQIALFRLSRNVSADVFSLLFEAPTTQFFSDFSLLCSGKNISGILCNINTQKINAFRRTLENTSRDLGSELLSKVGYFLKKSVSLCKTGDLDGACMAIVAAGKCALNYNICKFEGRPRIETNTDIAEFRKKLAHNIYTFGYVNILGEIKDFIDNRVNTVLEALKREIKIAGFEIIFDEPGEKREESPRIFFQRK